jgi:hypothetical protein
MAEYIKFRMAAAKLSVSMAFFALLAGLAEQARAASAAAKPAAPANFLRESASSRLVNVPTSVILKLDSALATLEHKLATSFDTSHKINQTFLKIKSANTEFLKIRSADAQFLKIDGLTSALTPLEQKIDAVGTTFLKITDANAEFLKVGSTAANSSALGGLAPSAFFQGNGHVVSAATTAPTTSGTTSPLLSLPGGIIVVSVSDVPGQGLNLIIHNGTGALLPAVQDGHSTPISLQPNADTTVVLGATDTANEVHLQIFPSGQTFPDVVTLIVSSAPPPSGGAPMVVGQAFTGGV